MKNKLPICKCCRERFIPRYNNSLQKYCMEKDECIKAFTDNHKATKEKSNAKEWSKEKKERKEAIMSHSEWLKILQAVFNTYIRERDKNLGCISCETKKWGIKYDAGHFFSVGGFSSVRFDEDNVHKQCSNNCNIHLSANIHEYRPRLIKKIGIERFEALEYRARNTTLKLSVPEIKEKIEYYKQKIKQLKNENN